jgi:hypothetical protein
MGQILDYSLKPVSQTTVRRAYTKWRVLEAKPYQCDSPSCPLQVANPVWNGKPLSLTLDHVDGNRKNNRPANLRLLCPNCDSQLHTRGGKNRGRIRDATVDSYRVVERDGEHETKVMLQGQSTRGGRCAQPSQVNAWPNPSFHPTCYGLRPSRPGELKH